MGPAGFTALTERFGDLAALFGSHHRELRDLPPPLVEYLAKPDWGAVERDLEWARSPGRSILTWGDPRFPHLLREIPAAPPILFTVGPAELLTSPQIAMVGSRNPSPSGKRTAHEFAAALATAGWTVTSGLALGIDGAAHQGALSVGGASIAVLGTGPDLVYPPAHASLLARLLDGGGAVVSEFFPGTPPLREHFPRRNRIISGLTLGTLVVEAALRSGSLITARNAADQGREVFAVPGSIHNPLSKGCHRLIREGAKLVESPEEILEEFPFSRSVGAPQVAGNQPATQRGGGDREQVVLGLFEPGVPVSVDVLAECCGLTPGGISSILLALELQGYVVSTPGGLYMRADKRD